MRPLPCLQHRLPVFLIRSAEFVEEGSVFLGANGPRTGNGPTS
jgi:hypothetical protein